MPLQRDRDRRQTAGPYGLTLKVMTSTRPSFHEQAEDGPVGQCITGGQRTVQSVSVSRADRGRSSRSVYHGRTEDGPVGQCITGRQGTVQLVSVSRADRGRSSRSVYHGQTEDGPVGQCIIITSATQGVTGFC